MLPLQTSIPRRKSRCYPHHWFPITTQEHGRTTMEANKTYDHIPQSTLYLRYNPNRCTRHIYQLTQPFNLKKPSRLLSHIHCNHTKHDSYRGYLTQSRSYQSNETRCAASPGVSTTCEERQRAQTIRNHLTEAGVDLCRDFPVLQNASPCP